MEILDLMPLFVFRQGEFAYHNFLAVVAYEFEPALNWETAGFRWCESGSWPEPLHFGLAALLDDDVSVGVMQAMVVSQMGEALAPAAAA